MRPFLLDLKTNIFVKLILDFTFILESDLDDLLSQVVYTSKRGVYLPERLYTIISCTDIGHRCGINPNFISHARPSTRLR